MVLLELAGQNVRGMSPALRVALKPGYVVAKPPGAEVPPLAQLLLSLFFADGRGGDAQFIAPGQKAGKAGVTMLGNDQTTYRLVRDLGSAGSLHKLDRATGKFAVVTEDPTEMAQLLRSSVGLPSRGAYEALFTLFQAQLPSKRGAKGKPGATGRPSGSKMQLASSQAVEAAPDVAAAQAKVKQLEKELLLSKEIDQVQFKLDGVSSQIFELETKLKGTQGLKQSLGEAEAAFNAAPTPETLGLPKDILSRCERYPQLVQRRDEALAKLGGDGGPPPEELAEEVVSAAYVPPLRQDARFVGGLLGGAVFLGLGLYLHGPAKYVTLLDIPSFGFAALVALKHIEDLQEAQRTTRKGGMRGVREKKIRENFEAEAQPVQQAMKALGVETPGEVIELLAKKPMLAEKASGLRQQLKALEADPVFAQASQQYAKLQREHEQLNRTLLDKGGGVRPPSEVEREIQRTKESIKLAQQGGGAPAEPTFSPVSAEPGESHDDPIPGLVKLASDLYGQDIPTVAGVIKDRCAQYVAALTDKRYHAVELDREGRATAVAPGRKVLASQLAAKDLDLVWLAVRLTLVEKAVTHAKVPFVIEDVFGQLDPAKAPLFARMLKHLGTATQVVHAATQPGFESVADLVAKL